MVVDRRWMLWVLALRFFRLVVEDLDLVFAMVQLRKEFADLVVLVDEWLKLGCEKMRDQLV